MTLSADYARCTGVKENHEICENRETCQRFTCRNVNENTLYFEAKDECGKYIVGLTNFFKGIDVRWAEDALSDILGGKN